MRGQSLLLAALLSLCIAAPASAKKKHHVEHTVDVAEAPVAKKKAKSAKGGKADGKHAVRAETPDDEDLPVSKKRGKPTKLKAGATATVATAALVASRPSTAELAPTKPAVGSVKGGKAVPANVVAPKAAAQTSEAPAVSKDAPAEREAGLYTPSSYGDTTGPAASDVLKPLKPAQMATRMARMAIDTEAVKAKEVVTSQGGARAADGWQKQ